ncbi:MAG: AraC family transcriptional regulator [Ideonella sp. MAG2]|nr:MAG: AraC family transcriptional regulator [Ideonella sp. MAG2]
MTDPVHADDTAQPLRTLDYQAPRGYAYDLEVLRFAKLRQLKPASWFHTVERLGLYLLILVDTGSCTHMAECQFLELAPGSLVCLRPGQVQRYDVSTPWDGWLLLMRPEVLDPLAAQQGPLRMSTAAILDEMPMCSTVSPAVKDALLALMAQMARDASADADPPWTGRLLKLQVQTLCARLAGHQATQVEVPRAEAPADRGRVARFKSLLERDFTHAHHVGHYAQLLGVAERSLSRSTQRVLGQTAKEVITARVLLEAKRLLVYTSDPVAQIGYSLGFDEATNFAKFFRRETGQGLQAFRRSVLDR